MTVKTARILLATLGLALLATQPAAQAQQQEAGGQVDPAAARFAAPVLDRLNAAWDAGDGAAFAAQFAEGADVINIFGEHFRGGPDLVRRMQFIFDGIFKGSTHVERNLEIARYLDAETILVVTSSLIAVPAGPLAPETRNRQTFILERNGDQWHIRHWHNTTIRPGN